jgi:hypothetical protein
MVRVVLIVVHLSHASLEDLVKIDINTQRDAHHLVGYRDIAERLRRLRQAVARNARGCTYVQDETSSPIVNSGRNVIAYLLATTNICLGSSQCLA